MTHSKQPWRAYNSENGRNLKYWRVIDADGKPVCMITSAMIGDDAGMASSEYATAQLIAAAPELLACLIEMASGHSMAGEARARAAIAKATGNA